MADGEPIQNHSTETDAKFLNIFGKKKDAEGKEGDAPDAGWSQTPVAPNPGCDRDAEEYNMRHTHRGVALLFNHERIPGMAVRSGTDKDCKRLAHELTELGFEVYIHNDLKYQQIMDVISQVSSADHSGADCLLVAVMTHGDPGVLHSRDRRYQVRELWQPFTAVTTLAGKPKLFFIQPAPLPLEDSLKSLRGTRNNKVAPGGTSTRVDNLFLTGDGELGFQVLDGYYEGACRGTKVDDGLLVTDSDARSRDVTDAYTTGYYIPSQADIMVAYSTVEGKSRTSI
uniref:Caspase family p20 domain-containing protein n=1 Tax=Timema shepardi TaxID=629360 RepID=A0A7R9AZV2_TIMSH|nr:unnamed protein product [Timema shepardi]